MGDFDQQMDKLIKVLRLVGALCGIASVVLGIVNIITISINPRTIVNNIYSIIFGFLMVACECRWTQFLRHFYFLTHFLGLGLFYIFIGGVALGGRWYMYLVAGFLFGVGIIYAMLGCCGRRMGKETFRKYAPGAAAIPGVSGGTVHGGGASSYPTQEMATSAYGNSAYGNNSNVYDNGQSYEEPAAIRDARQNKSAYDSNPF